MPKNIVIFSDGTGQDGGQGANTNIYKIFNMIESRTSKQVSYYDRGLGTGVFKAMGSIAGFGISKNIKDCYSFIFEHYEAGDKIYLLGFSRGAATMRSLSNFIHHFGVMPKSRPELISKAYKIYKIKNKEKRDRKAQEFISRHHTMWTKIEYIGCFDTVAALGFPYKSLSSLINNIPLFQHKFHDFKLSQAVSNAYQALAIDDERKTFLPILWDSDVLDGQKVKQVWFCGMHTDVGGGYEKEDLSDIPLKWMLDTAKKHGLKIYSKNKVVIKGDVNGKMHDSRGSFLSKVYRKKQRFWGTERSDAPIVHSSVLERTKNQQNEAEPDYKPWILKLDFVVEKEK